MENCFSSTVTKITTVSEMRKNKCSFSLICESKSHLLVEFMFQSDHFGASNASSDQVKVFVPYVFVDFLGAQGLSSHGLKSIAYYIQTKFSQDSLSLTLRGNADHDPPSPHPCYHARPDLGGRERHLGKVPPAPT